MNRKRPQSVYVLAILSFVYGGLLLVCGLCAGGGLLVSQSQWLKDLQTTGMKGKQADEQRKLTERLERVQKKHAPHANLIAIARAGAQILFAGMLFIGAYGLLRMEVYGRSTHILYALLAVLLQIAGLIYTVLVTLPANEAMNKAMLEELGGQQKKLVEAISPMMSAAGSIAVFTSLGGLLHPVATLIILFMPSNVEAFRAAAERLPEVDDGLEHPPDEVRGLEQPEPPAD